jgi:AraC-like DNA-binding protein
MASAGTSSSSSASSSARAILTFLTPAEQQRVEAAGAGCYTSIHRENLDQMLQDMRTHSVSAVVVSVSRYQQHHAPTMARIVREFPNVPAVALLTANEARVTQSLLALGQHGVRTLVDAREPAGWRDLRTLITRDSPRSIESLARTRLRDDLQGACPACLRFVDALFTMPLSCTTVRAFARAQGVLPTTFMTRFFRAGLPPAKKYVTYARLVRAARLFENPGYSVTQVAFQLEYSSPQSFSRHLHVILDLSASEFRRRYTGESMFERFRDELILPYRGQLNTFDPYVSPPQWIARRVPDDIAADPDWRAAPRDSLDEERTVAGSPHDEAPTPIARRRPHSGDATR